MFVLLLPTVTAVLQFQCSQEALRRRHFLALHLELNSITYGSFTFFVIAQTCYHLQVIDLSFKRDLFLIFCAYKTANFHNFWGTSRFQSWATFVIRVFSLGFNCLINKFVAFELLAVCCFLYSV